MTRRFVDGIDLCEDTDFRRLDQISRGSSSCRFAREALVAVEGRELAIILLRHDSSDRFVSCA